MGFKKVATLEGLWSGETVGLVVDERKVLLVNMNGTIYAYEDKCAHKGVRLSESRLEGNLLTCWAHHWQYDLATGKGINPPSARLTRWAVKVENGDILVDVQQIESNNY